jgi:excisionase family DNA binding protein
MTTTYTTTWLGAAEVAEMLDLSRSKVQAMAKAGTIPAYRIGKSYRFAKDQVGQWIEVQKITPIGEGLCALQK